MGILPVGRRQGHGPKDLAGRRFGRLIAVRVVGRTPGRHYVWACVCDCGASLDVVRGSLLSGRKVSCGCIEQEESERAVRERCRRAEANAEPPRAPVRPTPAPKMSRGARTRLLLADGEAFGRLTVMDRAPGLGNKWLCRCSCGGEATYTASSLLSGRRRSCGRCHEVRRSRGVRLCSACHRELPLAAFWARKNRGLQYACRDCLLSNSRARYKRDLDASREQRRIYARGDKRASDRAAADRRLFPGKRKAHTAVYRATKAGILQRPEACSRCGDRHRVEAHHDDYRKPLDVMWLCTACHRRRHAELAAIGLDPDVTAKDVTEVA